MIRDYSVRELIILVFKSDEYIALVNWEVFNLGNRWDSNTLELTGRNKWLRILLNERFVLTPIEGKIVLKRSINGELVASLMTSLKVSVEELEVVG